MSYSLYLDGVRVPVMPEKIKLKVTNQNKPINLINEGEVNVLKDPGLTEVQFELLLPQVAYPFAVYPNGFRGAEYYLNKLQRLKTNKRPFQFVVSRVTPRGSLLFDTNLKVSLEDYQITEDAGEGFDVVASVKLKQYRSYGTKAIILEQPTPTTATAAVEPTRESTTAPQVKTYTVKSGDCLWNIAKQYLGDGSRYTEIYNLNRDKITNPNLIYVGQVLTMP